MEKEVLVTANSKRLELRSWRKDLFMPVKRFLDSTRNSERVKRSLLLMMAGMHIAFTASASLQCISNNTIAMPYSRKKQGAWRSLISAAKEIDHFLTRFVRTNYEG